MILLIFIEKTWILWWLLALVAAIRWFHLISAGPRVETSGTLAPGKQEEYRNQPAA